MAEFTILHFIGIVALIVLYVVTIWAITVTVRDATVLPVMTALWVAALILFPGIGLLAWVLWRAMRKSGGLPGFVLHKPRKH